MPPEGAKWVKTPQNRKKHLWLPEKKFSKINEAKKNWESREAFVWKRTLYHRVEKKI